MDASAFKLGEKLNNRKVDYVLHSEHWRNFNHSRFNLAFTNWTVIKYLDSTGKRFSSSVNKIPINSGGLYLFFVKCKIISGITEYPLYIGRAQYTSSQNLRKRVKEYYQKYSKSDERPKIHRMFEYWAKDLHVAFYPIRSNRNTVRLEKDIINSLLLPMNDLIPDTKIRKAVKAFKI